MVEAMPVGTEEAAPSPLGLCQPSPFLGSGRGSGAPVKPQWAGMLPAPDWRPQGRHGTGRNPMSRVQMEAPTLPRKRVKQRKSEIRSCGDQQLSITLLPTARNIGCCLLDKVTTKQDLCCPEHLRGRW